MRKQGFTLIELMIVVAIIGILAALAIPDFMKMFAKTQQSEANTNLNAIYICQMSYFAAHETYAGVTTPRGDAFTMIGWEPKSQENVKYAYVLDEATLTGPKVSLPSGMPSGISSTKTSFTATAAGNIDTDTAVDIWTINDARDLNNVSNDVRVGGY